MLGRGQFNGRLRGRGKRIQHLAPIVASGSILYHQIADFQFVLFSPAAQHATVRCSFLGFRHDFAIRLVIVLLDLELA